MCVCVCVSVCVCLPLSLVVLGSTRLLGTGAYLKGQGKWLVFTLVLFYVELVRLVLVRPREAQIRN